MPELASDPVWAHAIFPKSFALPVFVELTLACVNQFMFAVGKSTLFTVVAVTQL
jgi:hypothetical protein